jgi:hypothetical protein
MKTKLFILVLVAVFNINCSTPTYLPSSKEIGVHQFGSYIKIKHKNNSYTSGELIAIERNKIIVLKQIEQTCVTVPISDVDKFKLNYAKPKNYEWTIPFGVLLPFIHGSFSYVTLPIHLLGTISVTAAGKNAFKYSEKNMTYDQLRMFARFPQGIPRDVDLSSIK